MTEAERAAAGWERRFIADRVRAEEAVRLYEEMGYEVDAVPVRPDEDNGKCGSCELPVLLEYRIIYTRRPGLRASPA